MPNSKLDPHVADQAPQEDELTDYDREHFPIYLRLLHAETEGADWAEAARIVLQIYCCRLVIGRDNCASLLKQNLDEEKAADKRRTDLAESRINRAAA